MTIRKFGCLAVVLLVAGVALAQEKKGDKPAAAPATGAAIGKPAPEFTLKDLDGKEHKLSSYKGKIVVVEFTNFECPVVNRMAGPDKTLGKTFAKFTGKNVAWLGIDSNNGCDTKVEAMRKWTNDKKMAAPILLDPDGKVGKSFGATNTPHIFIIDAKGNLAYMGAIDDDEAGTKTNARNYVIEAVDALLNGSTVATATTKAYGCTIKYKK